MTKVSVFGQETEKKKGKPIEFVKVLSSTELKIHSWTAQPSTWDNILLLQRNHVEGLDLIYAYQNGNECSNIYLGHWNDGFVE